MSEARPRVLIVEDEPGWYKGIMRCELLTQMREQDPDSVVIVESYEAAEEQLNASQFDVAITDLRLVKGKSEFEWRSLARLLQQKQIPIVVVSAYLDLGLVAEMVNEYGAAGIFDKNKLDPLKLSTRLSSICAPKREMLCATPGLKCATWLHLSDLHFRGSDQYDQNIVIEALWSDLERCKGRGLQPDFIVVTGDIAYSGKPEEYDLAKKFFDRLLNQAKVSKEQLFVVPGNHDVDRSKILPLARNALDNKKRVREVWEDGKSCALFMQRFEGYTSFIRSYLPANTEDLAFDNDRWFYSKVFNLHDYRIAVLGLNSAWTSGNVLVNGQVSDKGQLVVGEKQVMDALRVDQEALVKIAIMHHPLSYLQDFDSSDARTLLNRHCHFLLHGHLHEPDVERIASMRGNLIVIPAGAMYQERGAINSYNFGVLDFEHAKVRVVFRRYSDVQREWLKDLDATGEARDGELEFDLQL